MTNLPFTKKILFIVFYPVGWLWQRIYKVRRLFYEISYFRSEKINIPVISIGNITFGGTGKTPVTIFLANYLHNHGKKVMVLSRGYKSQKEDSYALLRNTASLRYDARVYGDEPVLISEKLKSGSVVIGKNRGDNFERYFFQEKPHVILLDDGHQHLKVQRDLNIVLFDALTPLSNYHYPPVGQLREGWNALQDANVVMINRVDIANEKQIKDLETLITQYITPHTPVIRCIYEAQGWYQNDHTFPVNHLKGEDVICVAGIASPDSFMRLVTLSGANVVKTIFYADHFKYQKNNFDEIMQEGKRLNAHVVCTEKDIVKLRAFINDEKVFVLNTGIRIVEGENDFFEKVNSICSIRETI